MILKKKAVPFILTATLACVAFIPSFVSASTTNYELADNPTAVMEAINSIGTPLSDEMAEGFRGEGLTSDIFGTLYSLSISWGVSPTAFIAAGYRVVSYYGWSWNLANGGAKALGWEIGRALALRDGNPDIGPFYAPSNVAQLFPWYIQTGIGIVGSNM